MKYFDKIDGLRFVAIVFVLIEHFADTVGHKITAGYYGVDLFFIISGFLITNILLKSKGTFFTCYKNFVGRRTLRIFPIYYLMLAFMFAVGYEPCRTYILYFATYTINYAWVHFNIPMNALSHYWSLAIEEQFYVFWPFFILGLRGKPKVMLSLTALIIVVCFFQLTTQVITIANPYNFVGLFTRAGSLCLGALGGMLYHYNKLSDEFFGKNIVVEWIVLIALAITLVTTYDLKFIVLALCSFYIVLKSVHSDFSIGWINKFLTNRKVHYIGSISYGIYIFHLPIGYFITTKFVSPWWCAIDFNALGRFEFIHSYLWVVLLPTYSLLSIAVAALSSRFIEKPILTLKDRFFK